MAGYTVNITEVRDVVTATSSVNNITITSDNNPEITVVENSFLFTATSVLNTLTIYTDAIELLVDDFANYFKGDWISGNTYRRGQLVNDRLSLFVCSTGTLTTVTSTINPSDYRDTLSWTRVVWNEGPRAHLTVTNYLDVGTTATLSGPVSARNFVTISTSGSRPVGPAGFDTTSLLTNDAMTWLAGNTAIGNRNFPAETPQPPTTGRTFSLIVYGNQFVTSSTTAGGDINANRDIVAGRNLFAIGNASVLGVTTSGNLVVTNTASILGSLSVGDITGNGGVSIAGPLRVDGISTFSNYINFNGTATFNNDVVLVNPLTLPSLTVTNSLRVAGVLYPVNTGSYGQVIANMGDYTAQWRNLGDLVFWSLSDDLRTNGFDIVSGSSSTQLTIGNGPVTGTPRGYLKFEENQINLRTPGGITIQGGQLPSSEGDIDISTVLGDVFITASRTKSLDMYGGSVNVTSEGGIYLNGSTVYFGSTGANFDSAFTFFSSGFSVTGGNVQFSTSTQGIQFGDGTIQRTASTSTISTTATSTRLGGVKIGSGISITADGTISAEGGSGGGETIVAAGTGTAVYTSIVGSATTYTVALTPASSGTLGGVIVGSGLAIDGAGVLSTTATSTIASRAELGVVIIGSGINVTSTGSISVPVASASVRGSIRVGTGLSIDGDGILSGSATLNTGTFSLSSDAKSNEFKITDDTTLNYLRLDGPGANYDVNLVAGGTGAGVLISANTTATITAGTVATISAGQIALSSTATTTVGSGVNNSELRVQKIYNYAGTYAPFFPAGIQLADNTVQITAYHPDGGPLPAV